MTSPRNTTTTITVVSVFLLTTHPLTCRPSGQPPQKPEHPEGYPALVVLVAAGLIGAKKRRAGANSGGNSDPMREAGATSTGMLECALGRSCARPTGGRMVAPPEVPRN